MAAFNRVMDYLKGMPDNAEHKAIYYEKWIERHADSKMKNVDFKELEKEIISPGEKNAIRAFCCQDKFTLSNFKDGFGLNAVATAKTNTGVGVIHETNQFELNFRSELYWYLNPNTSYVSYSNRSTTLAGEDLAVRSMIQAACPNMPGTDSGGLGFYNVSERLSKPSNTQHLFAKMYLTLCDYTLSIVSKCDTRQVSDSFTYKQMPNISAKGKIAAINTYQVVVDADGFTPQELGLLALASAEYPSVWYAGDNIYTMCNMEADRVVIVSDRSLEIDTTMSWGSPDRLYNLITSLACKLDAVDCMMTAFSEMRGMCPMMRDLRRHTETVEFSSPMPLSINYKRALGGANVYASVASSQPGFISSSYALVTEMLLGKQFEASASCVVEELGGFGDILCGSIPKSDRVFNGLARDYGLDHADSEVNILLLNWGAILGRRLTWGFGAALKDYVISLADQMKNLRDIDMPQVMDLIPYTYTPHSAWGQCRGWTGLKRTLDSGKEANAKAQEQLAAFGWMIGINKQRPKLFRNKGHKPKPQFINPRMYELEAQSRNGYQLEFINFYMRDTLGGRMDEHEHVAGALYQTEYTGTKCSLVYDKDQEEWIQPSPVPPPDYDRIYRTSVRGEILEAKSDEAQDVRPVTFGGAPKSKDVILERVKHLGGGSRVMVTNRKNHVRINSNSEAYVSPYTIGGQASSSLIPDNNPSVTEGEIIRALPIEVPGDGQCGLHAVFEDLKAHGYINQVDVSRARESMQKELSTDSFHDAEEIAGIVAKWGFGLDVYDRRGGSAHLYRYGGDEAKHRVTLLRENGHFRAMHYGDGGEEFKVDKVTGGDVDPEELINNVANIKKVFSFR